MKARKPAAIDGPAKKPKRRKVPTNLTINAAIRAQAELLAEENNESLSEFTARLYLKEIHASQTHRPSKGTATG